MRLSWLLVIVVALMSPYATQAAENPAVIKSAAGVVKTLQGAVSVERGSQRTAVAKGFLVLVGDLVTTGSDGSVGITLRDNTLLSAGPNSSLSLKDFAFDPSTQAGTIDATLNCGTLAVVSGAIAKHSPERVRLSTPVTLIGVRGTEFLVRAGCKE